MKMMLFLWRKRISRCLLSLLLVACTTVLAQSLDTRITQLVITQFPEQHELARYSLGPENSFSLSFVHSVSNTRVVDVYKVRDASIIQTRELFKTHGAGLPSNSEEPGGLSWEQTEDGFVLHMERDIPKLVVRTNETYQNRLQLPSGEVNLNQWEDQPLLLYIESVPFEK